MSNSKVTLLDKHLVLAVPAYDGKVPIEWLEQVALLQHYSIEYKFKVSLSYQSRGALITNNRNIAVADFLSYPDATHLLFIDSDILFKADDILRLLTYASLTEHEIIHVPYPLKSDIPQFHVEVGHSIEMNKYGLWRSYAAGCGFVMIQRQVLERMIAHYPELKYYNRHLEKEMYALFDQMIVEGKDGLGPMYMGEDVAFFRRWRLMDGQMWCDPEIRLQHVGTKVYNADLSHLLSQVQETRLCEES